MCLLWVLSIVLMQLGVGSPAVANASALFGSSIWREPANEPWPDAIARHDAMFGPLQAIRIFFAGAPKPWTAPELSHSRPVVASFKISPREVLEGRHDDTMRAWFAAAPRNRTVWWVYWHEPEDNIAKSEFTAADYRAAFTRLDGLANQASNPMLRTTQVLMDWTLDSRSQRNWRDYYPGANVIDVQAWDQYGYASEPGCAHESMAAHEARVPAYQTTVAEGNDYAIAEIGSLCIPQRAAWLRDVCAWGSSRAVFVTYFHSFGPLGDYRLNDPASREAWKSCKPADPTRAVDFDGDGLADRAVYRPAATTGTWHVLQSATNSSTQRAYGARDDIPVAGDYDGDGRLNYALWRPPNGTWYILLADGSTRDVAFGQAGDIPVPGDYDGDRKTDVAVWRPSNGTWYVQRSSDARIVTNAWGQNGDKPVLGDFDGDKKTDFAVWRPSTGYWHIINSSSSSGSGEHHAFGASKDKPVPGDYNGDARTDIAVWRPSNGTWYVRHSDDGQVVSQAFGQQGDIPVPAYYDGDTGTDYAVWRPSNGTWYVINSSSGLSQSRQFGQAGDKPIAVTGTPKALP